MQTQHIALVPEAGGLSSSELLRVSAALQRQVSSQFGPIWELSGTVDAFAEIEDVPAGYWPIVLSPPDQDGIRAGIHLDQNSQPYARVKLSAGWSLDASRACLEMLANPFGRRTLSAHSPRTDQGPAEILLEVCGAFGDVARAYVVNDVPVADFCTPAFFDAPARRANERYSYRGGSFSAPLQLLRGGHLAWFDAISNSWWLRSFHDEHPSDLSLGALRLSSKSVRELVLQHAPQRPLSLLRQESLDERVGLSWLGEQGSAASRARGERLRALLTDSQDTERIVVDVPVALHEERARRQPLPRFAGQATRRELSAPSRRQTLEYELREVVAAELDAADVALEDESVVNEAEPIRHEHEFVAQERDVVAQEREALAREREAIAQEREAIARERAPIAQREPSAQQPPAAAPVSSDARAQVLPPPLVDAGNAARVQSSEAPRPSAARAAPSTPTQPRISSIAPIAMLDSAARPKESRLGLILVAAAVAALAFVVFSRQGSRASTQHAHQIAPAQVAPVTPSTPAPAAPVVNTAPASAPAARTSKADNKREAALKSPAEPRASVRAELEQASSQSGEAKSPLRDREKREEAAEKRREARALLREREIARAGEHAPSADSTRAPAASTTIEGLLDTRR